MDYRSTLGKVKGLGSAKEGVAHWWMQRVTAIAMIPLLFWFVITMLKVAGEQQSLLMIFTSPVSVVLFLLLAFAGLYHGALGIQVVAEDYISCKCARKCVIVFTQLFAILTGFSLLVAVLGFHVVHLGL